VSIKKISGLVVIKIHYYWKSSRRDLRFTFLFFMPSVHLRLNRWVRIVFFERDRGAVRELGKLCQGICNMQKDSPRPINYGLGGGLGIVEFTICKSMVTPERYT
jgi:hypothetical protein